MTSLINLPTFHVQRTGKELSMMILALRGNSASLFCKILAFSVNFRRIFAVAN